MEVFISKFSSERSIEFHDIQEYCKKKLLFFENWVSIFRSGEVIGWFCGYLGAFIMDPLAVDPKIVPSHERSHTSITPISGFFDFGLFT